MLPETAPHASAPAPTRRGWRPSLVEGRMSICRRRSYLPGLDTTDAAGIDDRQGRSAEAARWSSTAEGDVDKDWGNETIRWHPGQCWLEVKLPVPLARLANLLHGRYRIEKYPLCLSGHNVAAKAKSGAVSTTAEINPSRGRWYRDHRGRLRDGRYTPTSCAKIQCWPTISMPPGIRDSTRSLGQSALQDAHDSPGALRVHGQHRDGRLRGVISDLLRLAAAHSCLAVVIEDLDFEAARGEGRERSGCRPSRGRRGRGFRRLVLGISTGGFWDRLVQMATNVGLAVVAVDPAYTSRWGAQHRLGALKDMLPDATGHHAAAVVIGRLALGQRARRRERRDRPDRRIGKRELPTPPCRPYRPWPVCPKRETGSLRTATPEGSRNRDRAPDRPNGHPPGNQVVQDRSGPPVTVSRLMPMNADEPGTVVSEPVPNDPTREKGSDESPRTPPRAEGHRVRALRPAMRRLRPGPGQDRGRVGQGHLREVPGELRPGVPHPRGHHQGAALRAGQAPPVGAVDRLLQAPALREVPAAARSCSTRPPSWPAPPAPRAAPTPPRPTSCSAKIDEISKIFWETKQG